MEIIYEKCGDYLVPNLLPDPEPEGELRKYGLMIQEQAENRFDILVRQMAERENVTEELKAKDQMSWVRKMNNIYARADEIVREEIVYML